MSSFSNENTVSISFILNKTELFGNGKLREEEDEEGKGCLTLELETTRCLNIECIF